MNSNRVTRRQATTVVLLLALVATLATAGDAVARATKRARADGDESTARGRIDTAPMTLMQGELSGGRGGQWSVDGRNVRFEENFTLVTQAQSDAAGLPRSGAQVVLMGYQRGDVFVAYSGIMFAEANEAERPDDVNKDAVEWSATDRTVGKAPPTIPK